MVTVVGSIKTQSRRTLCWVAATRGVRLYDQQSVCRRSSTDMHESEASYKAAAVKMTRVHMESEACRRAAALCELCECVTTACSTLPLIYAQVTRQIVAHSSEPAIHWPRKKTADGYSTQCHWCASSISSIKTLQLAN